MAKTTELKIESFIKSEGLNNPVLLNTDIDITYDFTCACCKGVMINGAKYHFFDLNTAKTTPNIEDDYYYSICHSCAFEFNYGQEAGT